MFTSLIWVFPVHVYWRFRFQQYAPGVLLLLPAIAYLAAQAVRAGYVPGWYVALLVALQVPALAQAVKAGNRMLPSFRPRWAPRQRARLRVPTTPA